MKDPLHKAKWEMIEAGGRTAQSLGLSRLYGQIYIFLYLSDTPQSLDELALALGVSKASVSITCRQLEGWGALKRTWIRGDRKDYYRAETDVGLIINNGLLPSINKKLNSARIQIERSLQLLDSESGLADNKDFLKTKLCEAERYRAKAAKLLGNPIIKHIFS